MPSPIAVTRLADVLLLVPIFLLIGLAAGLAMIVVARFFAAQFLKGNPARLHRLWYEQGWHRWLGRNLPPSPTL